MEVNDNLHHLMISIYIPHSIETLMYSGTHRLFLCRICEHCTVSEIGDEMHLVFECPAVQHVRDQYAHLFTFATSTMRTFLWQDDIISVITYVVACMDFLR